MNNQETLELILDSAPIAIVMANESGNILYANAKLLEMFGYEYSELAGQPIERLIPERFHLAHVRHRESYAQKPHVRPMGSGMDLLGRRADGSEFPLEAGLSHVYIDREGDGEPLAADMLIIVSITDITRRKQTEEALEQRVEERTRELERRRQVSDGLRDILTVLNSNRPLEEILEHITAQACRLLHADASAIYRITDAQGRLALQASYGLPPSTPEETDPERNGPDTPTRLPDEAGEHVQAEMDEVPRKRAPVVVHSADRMSISSSTGARRQASPEQQGTNERTTRLVDHRLMDHRLIDYGYRALLTVPLFIKEEPYGSLILYYQGTRKFSSEEIELATSVGDQTALAIENARLRTQVERTAVAAERSRIARDLHDSVTQTLFSASLIAEVLPRIWRRDVEESERRLEELRQLTRGALAEMRTLLLELRPVTLREVALSELLRQLAEASTGRARVPITLEIEGDTPLPPDVKIAFYHIAQEALNNVAKHAQAHHASITLLRVSDERAGSPRLKAHLSVRDDGRGFVVDSVTPEHLGLSIMHERAEAIGARLEIESQLGRGTEVSVEWGENE